MSAAGRRLRVAHVYAHLEIGGIERSIVELLSRLDRSRYEVRMICSRRRGRMAVDLEAAGVPVEVTRCTSRLPVSWSARRIARTLRRHGVDIVHAHAEQASHYATAAARLVDVPIVVATFHTGPGFGPRALERERRQWPARSANVYVGEVVRRDHLAQVRPEGGRSLIIHNGVDLARFGAIPSADRLEALRRELSLNGAAYVLLNVARLQRIKAPRDLLRAFAEVRALVPGAVLVMAGGGRRLGEVEAAVRELGLADAVRLVGVRTDVHDLYHLADLHVLASRDEGFSLVVLEAMAAGRPQVLTGVGGNPEAIGDSVAARLVPPGRPELLGAAIAELLKDEKARRTMGRAARERAARFRIDEQVVRTERLYDELAAGRAVPAR